jgi:hypothetical protein
MKIKIENIYYLNNIFNDNDNIIHLSIMSKYNCCYFWCFKMDVHPENNFFKRHYCGKVAYISLLVISAPFFLVLLFAAIGFFGLLLGLMFTKIDVSEDCSDLSNASFTIENCIGPGSLSIVMIIFHIIALIPVLLLFFCTINFQINKRINHEINKRVVDKIHADLSDFILKIPEYPRTSILILIIEIIISIVNTFILFPLMERILYPSSSCELVDYYWKNTDHNKSSKYECLLKDLSCTAILYGTACTVLIIWYIYDRLTKCTEYINNKQKESDDQQIVIIA